MLCYFPAQRILIKNFPVHLLKPFLLRRNLQGFSSRGSRAFLCPVSRSPCRPVPAAAGGTGPAPSPVRSAGRWMLLLAQGDRGVSGGQRLGDLKHLLLYIHHLEQEGKNFACVKKPNTLIL